MNSLRRATGAIASRGQISISLRQRLLIFCDNELSSGRSLQRSNHTLARTAHRTIPKYSGGDSVRTLLKPGTHPQAKRLFSKGKSVCGSEAYSHMDLGRTMAGGKQALSTRLGCDQIDKIMVGELEEQYMSEHPEVRGLLPRLVEKILAQKPDNISTFAQRYFENEAEAALVDAVGIEKIKEAPRPLVLAGPSGVGKGTLIAMLREAYQDAFGFSVSHTTRQPRPGEIDGVHYNFVAKEDMAKKIQEGGFIEHAEVHGNLYGTSVEAVTKVMDKGQICLLEIDTQGVEQVKKSSLNAHYLFVAPPSEEELFSRLQGRHTESVEVINRRVANAKAEMDYAKIEGNFEKIIVNDDLNRAFTELNGVINEWYQLDG